MIKTKNQATIFDFCESNHIKVSVTYKIAEEIHTVEGLISGYFDDHQIFCVKGEKGHDHCIPLKNLEKLIMKGKY